MSNIREWLESHGAEIDCQALKDIELETVERMANSQWSMFTGGLESIYWQLAVESIQITRTYYGCTDQGPIPDDPR